MTRELSLIARVRRGELNFERLVDVLSTRGYITDSGPHEAGVSFGRVAIDQARQEDFDALLRVLMPGQSHSIQLAKCSTDAGGIRGMFTNALFNANVIDHEAMREILVGINRRESQQP